jgi:hypothetical protein
MQHYRFKRCRELLFAEAEAFQENTAGEVSGVERG